MFTALRQPAKSYSLLNLSLQKSSVPKQHQQRQCSLPSLSSGRAETSRLSITKPLHVSSVTGSDSLVKYRKPLTQCRAYEANRAQPLDINIELPSAQSETAQRVKIGIYFAMWWALNVVFNIYNKKVLNVFPYPWLTSTLSLAAGSLMMLISWATRIADAPKTDMDFWKALLPVAVAHTIGHVAATISMSKVAVSFTHIIKSGEPAFSVLVSRFLLGRIVSIAGVPFPHTDHWWLFTCCYH
ncbi:hypothetical protein Nepgr_007166 [Nepenthes gracilis]|uniref:Sugar phosphate transporter domain-containing protein n=1 Tax=Nepenthes gracilis TaxID=150966 RepID=A0AAD3XI97_NEPGR|nr:hypothetical protein Nepgr_007166 [Nepenthes gracilis]